MPTIDTWKWAGITHIADADTGKVVLAAGDVELGHRNLTPMECEALRAGQSVAKRVLLRWHEAMWREQESALRWLSDPERRGTPPYREAVEILRAKGLVEGDPTVPGCTCETIRGVALRLTPEGEREAAEVKRRIWMG